MVRRIILTLIALLLLSQPSLPNPENQPQHNLAIEKNIEAYEVYTAVLQSEWPTRLVYAGPLVVRAETKLFDMCLTPDKESEKVIGVAIADYTKRNKQTWILHRDLKIEMPYVLISGSALNTIFRDKNGWKDFYKEYPNSGGWVEVSAVGFNEEKTVAVVYLGHHGGNVGGRGGFHVLQKKAGKWIPLEWKGTACMWDS